jgi:branched-chain amino acid transport system permease protein
VLAVSSVFWALLASGIAQGAVVALAALGFLITHKATGVVNFAQGDLITLGAFVAFWLTKDFDAPIGLAYAGSVAIMFCVGMFIERVAYAPLRGRSLHVVVIATLGVALVIRSIIGLWLGTSPVSLDSPAKGHTFELFGAVIPYQRLVILVVTAICVLALIFTFNFTSFGRQVRALASDRETAQLHGVRVSRMSLIAFGLSAALAAVAGCLIGANQGSFDITLGFGVMLGGFSAAILGGFGSLPGVVVGGFVLGLLEQFFIPYYLPELNEYKALFPYLLMILVIAVRPTGLFTRGTHVARL